MTDREKEIEKIRDLIKKYKKRTPPYKCISLSEYLFNNGIRSKDGFVVDGYCRGNGDHDIETWIELREYPKTT